MCSGSVGLGPSQCGVLGSRDDHQSLRLQSLYHSHPLPPPPAAPTGSARLGPAVRFTLLNVCPPHDYTMRRVRRAERPRRAAEQDQAGSNTLTRVSNILNRTAGSHSWASKYKDGSPAHPDPEQSSLLLARCSRPAASIDKTAWPTSTPPRHAPPRCRRVPATPAITSHVCQQPGRVPAARSGWPRPTSSFPTAPGPPSALHAKPWPKHGARSYTTCSHISGCTGLHLVPCPCCAAAALVLASPVL